MVIFSNVKLAAKSCVSPEAQTSEPQRLSSFARLDSRGRLSPHEHWRSGFFALLQLCDDAEVFERGGITLYFPAAG